MSFKFTPLHKHFGARLEGLDPRQPLTTGQVAQFDQAMDTYGVLVVPGEVMSPGEQMAFTRRFGDLDLGFRRVKTAPGPTSGHRFEYAELADISNVEVDNQVAQRTSRKIVSNVANQMWHSDSSFQRPRAKYSMLHAAVVPAEGGQTEFADQRNAWDRLDDKTKARIADMKAEHFALHSRFALGDTDYSQEQIDAIPPVLWPIVQTHAGSGRRHLYIGAHARAIEGMVTAEARMLLWDLLEHATLAPFVYRHEWQVGDLVIWDNRCMLHRGRQYDLSERRELRRSTVIDAQSAEIPEQAAETAGS